jgi:hypothetical protein
MIHARDPVNRVLDLGVGWGKYGLILRELYDGRSIMKDRDKWNNLTIDGVEVFERYVREHTRFIYDHIWIEDIHRFVRKYTGRSYDIALFIGTIEHMPKVDAMNVLQELKRFCKWTIVTTPNRFIPQDQAVKDYHELEQHISSWHCEDFGDDLITNTPCLISLIKGNIPSTYRR